jgi:glycosyltransferase involved in cell wall biosynthesis
MRATEIINQLYMMSSIDVNNPQISPPNSRKPRVLFVLGTLWGGNGIVSHLKTLSLGLRLRGIEVAVVSGIASANSDVYAQAMATVEDFRSQGIEYFIAPFSGDSLVKQLSMLPEVLKSLSTIVQDFQPTIIHLHSLSVIPYIHLLRLRHKIPFVSTCHMEPSPSASKSRMIRLIHRIMPNLFGDRFIAISSDLQQIFEKSLHVPATNVELIYHGIDSSYFRPPSIEEKIAAKQAFGFQESDQVICLIGRLSMTKGHDVLIRSMAILKHQGITPIALFAGKGYFEEEEVIRNCAIEYGVLDYIRFLGMTDSRKVLWASEVLVLPSRQGTEAFPLVIPEAMLCGVIPIRTAAAGAYDQINDGANGFIIAFEDPEMLADRLKHLLTNVSLRCSMAKESLRCAQNKFLLDTMLEKIIVIYQNHSIKMDI